MLLVHTLDVLWLNCKSVELSGQQQEITNRFQPCRNRSFPKHFLEILASRFSMHNGFSNIANKKQNQNCYNNNPNKQ